MFKNPQEFLNAGRKMVKRKNITKAHLVTKIKRLKDFRELTEDEKMAIDIYQLDHCLATLEGKLRAMGTDEKVISYMIASCEQTFFNVNTSRLFIEFGCIDDNLWTDRYKTMNSAYQDDIMSTTEKYNAHTSNPSIQKFVDDLMSVLTEVEGSRVKQPEEEVVVNAMTEEEVNAMYDSFYGNKKCKKGRFN